MKDPLGVSPSKGNQGTTRGGNRTHDLRIRSTVTLPTELRGRTEKVGDDIGGESRRRESKGTYDTFVHIFCSHICVYSATRNNIHMYPYFLFAAIHHLYRPRLSLSDLVAQSVE